MTVLGVSGVGRQQQGGHSPGRLLSPQASLLGARVPWPLKADL